MELVRAGLQDLSRIMELYDDIIDNTADIETYAKWKKDKHPTRDGIRQYIEDGAMYLLMDREQITGGMAVTMEQGSDYRRINWAVKAEDSEVAVVHVLGIRPGQQGRGLGSQMVDYAVKLARSNGKKALRLDALAANLPAQHMYETEGFICRGRQKLYAENTGWIDFLFYEYAL